MSQKKTFSRTKRWNETQNIFFASKKIPFWRLIRSCKLQFFVILCTKTHLIPTNYQIRTNIFGHWKFSSQWKPDSDNRKVKFSNQILRVGTYNMYSKNLVRKFHTSVIWIRFSMVKKLLFTNSLWSNSFSYGQTCFFFHWHIGKFFCFPLEKNKKTQTVWLRHFLSPVYIPNNIYFFDENCWIQIYFLPIFFFKKSFRDNYGEETQNCPNIRYQAGALSFSRAM